MRSLTILSYLLVFAALNAFGQTQAKNSASGKAASNTSIQRQGDIVSAGTITNAELTNAIDVRKSKVGDTVVLKTTKSIKQNGETVIPKGSRLVGRITEIQQKSKENGQSRIGMLFDRIEGNQISAPISVSIISMANAATNVSDVFASDTSASGSSNSSSRGSTGSGGLLSGVGNTVSGVVNTATQTTGSVVNTASQTVGNTTGSLGRTVNGIQLSQSASGSASGSTMLSSQNKNLRIEKGATFNVRFDGTVQN